MNVSLITTIKNEENSITEFLKYLSKQTVEPSELIIVDAYSRDNSFRLIEDFIPSLKFPVRIFKKRGNRSVGRNTAIRATKNKIIAVTDVGCIPDKKWLELLTAPFEDKTIDVSAGFYHAVANGPFQKCVAAYTCIMPDKLNKKNFLPSSRSIAFRKKAWKKVHGYPEKLDTCEDLVFDKKLKNAGMKFTTVPNAIVHWPQRSNIISVSRQLFSYALGDGKARYFRFQTPFLYARYILGAFLVLFTVITGTYELISLIVLLILVYVTWSIQKNYNYIKNWRAFFYLPLLQLVSDICVLTGTTLGFLYSFKGNDYN